MLQQARTWHRHPISLLPTGIYIFMVSCTLYGLVHYSVIDTMVSCTHYGVLYILWCCVHSIVSCTLYGVLYTLLCCTLYGVLYTLISCTVYGILYTLWCLVHSMMCCTCCLIIAVFVRLLTNALMETRPFDVISRRHILITSVGAVLKTLLPFSHAILTSRVAKAV